VAIVIDGAHRHDMKLVTPTLEEVQLTRPTPTAALPQGLCLDKGYDYDEVRAVATRFGLTAHLRTRGDEAQASRHASGWRARRWVVERTHSWLNRFRALLIRWAKKASNYLAFLHFACGLIAWRAAGLLG
jgi:transposase